MKTNFHHLCILEKGFNKSFLWKLKTLCHRTPEIWLLSKLVELQKYSIFASKIIFHPLSLLSTFQQWLFWHRSKKKWKTETKTKQKSVTIYIYILMWISVLKILWYSYPEKESIGHQICYVQQQLQSLIQLDFLKLLVVNYVSDFINVIAHLTH